MRNDEQNQSLAGQTAQLCRTPADNYIDEGQPTRTGTVRAGPQVASPDRQKLYVEKFGRFHTDAILSAWSAAMRKAIGIRSFNSEIEGGAPSPTRAD
jgi:hypothetical protein